MLTPLPEIWISQGIQIFFFAVCHIPDGPAYTSLQYSIIHTINLVLYHNAVPEKFCLSKIVHEQENHSGDLSSNIYMLLLLHQIEMSKMSATTSRSGEELVAVHLGYVDFTETDLTKQPWFLTLATWVRPM